MTLLMLNEEDLYHFENVEDAFLWIELHPSEEPIIMLGEHEDTEEVKHYLNEYFPIEILN